MVAKGKVLVTGGAGYIGSHTVVALSEAGYEPVIVDSFVNSSVEVIGRLERLINKKIRFYQLDCTDEAALADMFAKEGSIDSVIHFAAFKAVGESVADPLKYHHNNLLSLISLLRVMQLHGVAKLVFSSSCTVYGSPDQLPVTEHTVCKTPTSPYGNTKQICETILQDVAKTEDAVTTISLRYFNPIGAHQSSLIGELPIGMPNNLVPFITQAVAGKRNELTVFGNDYDTPDGTCIRDYIDVTDLAEAHVKALGRLMNNKSNSFEAFNIGTGQGCSVLQLIQLFEEATGEKVPYKFGPRRAGDVPQIYANVSKAKQVLGWEAKKTISESLLSSWRWQQTLS